MKQTKLRRRRVVRYAILYFILVLLMLALMVAPALLIKIIPKSLFEMEILQDFQLVQPTLNNDDTRGKFQTGTANPSYSGVLASSIASAKAAKATEGAQRMMLLI
jgi:1,3-beta-glucan synthase